MNTCQSTNTSQNVPHSTADEVKFIESISDNRNALLGYIAGVVKRSDWTDAKKNRMISHAKRLLGGALPGQFLSNK